jgi:class 3 adenylate cyclase/predicted ATPase
MFCDLVESTPLTELLDPEELHLVISAYQHTCFQVVNRFEGYTAQYLGDGLLIYFGYPQAHEDDAARAVRAGLAIVAELQQLNQRLQDEVVVLRQRPLQIRIGIHTGLVVVSEMGKGERRELMALGEAPNVANRLQTIAAPNSIVISAATQRLTEGFFSYQPLGLHTLRGVSTPLPVYQVVGEEDIRNRFEIAVSRGLTPLIGRERSLELLLRAWGKAKAGAGQVVLLKGESGIGKSRLVQSLKEQTANEVHVRFEYYCSPYHQHSALYPIIDAFQRRLHFTREDAPEEKFTKLEQTLTNLADMQGVPLTSIAEAIPFLAELLSLPLPARYILPQRTPQRQKQKTLEALLSWVFAVAHTQPVLVIVEDLHWADPSTLELLDLFLTRQQTAQMLTVLTYRPKFTLPMRQLPNFSQILLDRLSHEDVELMVEEIAKKPLPANVMTQIVEKSDGMPLYVEELTRAVLESDWLRESEDRYELTTQLPAAAIPASLQASLLARLDRLGVAKDVAQLGAVLGREFSYELLNAVAPPHTIDQIPHALAQLVGADILRQEGSGPRAHYVFKHALLQDTAYHTLLKSKRQRLHQRVAQVLGEQFSEIQETQPELVARHYTDAGLVAEALPYWLQAGRRALARSANLEAIAHLTQGISLTALLPDDALRVRQELACLTMLGPALIATRGWAAPEAGHVYTRARELSGKLGETPEAFSVLCGLWGFYLVRAEHSIARELAEQALHLARTLEDQALLVQSHWMFGCSLYFLGDVRLSREQLERGISLYDPQRHGSLAFLYGHDPGMSCRSVSAWGLWLHGFPMQALARATEAVSVAEQLSHPFSIAYAIWWLGCLQSVRGETQTAGERAKAVVALSNEQEFPYWEAVGKILHGWALVLQGQKEEGIDQLDHGIAAYQATGAVLAMPLFYTWLAEAYGRMEQPEAGLTIVNEALTLVRHTNERVFEAELYRLKGMLTFQRRHALKS